MHTYLLDIKDQIVPWLLTHGVRIVVIIIIAFLGGWILKKFIRRVLRTAISRDKFVSDVAHKKREDTLVRIFNMLIRLVIFTIAAIMVLQEAGIKVGPILASAGIVGIAVGFGGQYFIKDCISGFFIILENQYRIGDVVSLDGTGGLVEDLTLRMTTLRDADGTVHHIPHGSVNRVSNMSKYMARVNLNIGVSYDAGLEHVIRVINETGNELAHDPEWKDKIITPPLFLRVDDFADSAVIVKIMGDTQPIQQWAVTGELRKRLKIAFDREGIGIPYPQVVVHEAGDRSKTTS